MGISPERITEGLGTFAGIKRRLEVVGTASGVTIYDDFAHHPTAVAETLAGLRAAHPSARIWAVFEPRSASSCRRVFQNDFARAFAGADEVLLAPVFRSTLPESERLSVPELVRDLRAGGQSARDASSLDEIVTTIATEHRAGDLVVVMSNGHWRYPRQTLSAQRDPGEHVRVVEAGDSAPVGSSRNESIPALNARVVALADRLRVEPIAGVRECTTFRSCGIRPLRTSYDVLVARLEREAAAPDPPPGPDSDVIRVPVCHGGEFGPDLADVARFAGMTESAVVDLHTAPTYLVFMLGFAPGMAYLGVVDGRIAAPRRETPRVRVPRGSVGIAGAQTGIYPAETPGGWQVIGRTPVKPFDLMRPDPFLMKAGDLVSFVAIDRAEFDRLEQTTRSAVG